MDAAFNARFGNGPALLASIADYHRRVTRYPFRSIISSPSSMAEPLNQVILPWRACTAISIRDQTSLASIRKAAARFVFFIRAATNGFVTFSGKAPCLWGGLPWDARRLRSWR